MRSCSNVTNLIKRVNKLSTFFVPCNMGQALFCRSSDGMPNSYLLSSCYLLKALEHGADIVLLFFRWHAQ